MKKISLLIFVLGFTFISGCAKDDATDLNESKVFQLRYVEDPSLLGKVLIKKNTDGSSTISLQLNGTSTEVHPAYIYYNSLAQGGPIAITLDPCGCLESNTVVTKLDNGQDISYEELINFNGHVKIHHTYENIETILLNGNIGSNARNVY
ncbi:MAG: hypothetical protein WBM53_00010 [Maribacter sp.]